ncbi:UDP-N-acetylmuramate--L-alanine ligase [Quadrisphaera sp. DSM 44207]|uniref:UDP-N-acetylmuramate--L-alanine ligase n=1 Tax=Quadrisphaera sp. DSM 44207 TaxID=1881057 RepID=UPI00088DBBF1|nr:UDP-N-acetylmuramate--L-alanine ligase [Quadrisphaera sp. DSM 44207]SDQ53534.1 UDP-N-acetylmuramate--L-alanine ligase [Quadrisphaera sp. DSM 44207]
MSPRFDLDAPVPPAEELGAVHFVGVGGVGMSGVARVMLARGLRVSGSDAKDVPVLAALRALGGRVAVGFDPARLDGVSTVVAGSAIRESNPELAAARERGLRVLHRSQALQAVMHGRRVVAVAGTNGKTTTTSMLTVVLQHAGADPSFAVGGELVGAGTNAHEGTGDVFVAEADESDSSFLVYSPHVAVVTNVQPDHLDHYGTVDALEAAFAAFVDRVVPGGVLVACADDRGSAALAARARARGARAVTVGSSLDADVRLGGVRSEGARTSFDLTDLTDRTDPTDRAGGTGASGAAPVRVRLRVPGWHNVLDAAAAYAAATTLGVAPALAVEGLEAFTGTRRRFEARGEAGGVRVYDDYAHNPAKVAAAVGTAREVAGAGRLLVVFQPHLYSRTLDFAEDFARALSVADEVFVMDVYAAREDPVPGVTGALVADRVDLPPERVRYVESWSAVAPAVAAAARPGDLVLTVGAGDVTMVAGEVLSLLAEQHPVAGSGVPR